MADKQSNLSFKLAVAGLVSIVLVVANVWALYSIDNSSSSQYGTVKHEDFFDTISEEEPNTSSYRHTLAVDTIINLFDEPSSNTDKLADDNISADVTTDTTNSLSNYDYILAESNSRYITSDDVEHLTDTQLWIARNEIYARHGRQFNDDTLSDYFNGKSWYTPKYTATEFDALGNSLFNTYEIANIEFLADLS